MNILTGIKSIFGVSKPVPSTQKSMPKSAKKIIVIENNQIKIESVAELLEEMPFKAVPSTSKEDINQLLDGLEKGIKDGPGGSNGRMGGGVMVREKGKIKTITFNNKKDALDVIKDIRNGKMELIV